MFFTGKDALPANDPDKLILGAELDGELSEVQSTMETKYDSEDIASEAQAEAGLSNEVLMTPLRVAELIGDAGGGGAGIVGDLISLTDPGDDRILFWDESIDSAAFLDIGTHLETTAGAVLNVTEGTIDHDALLNFVGDDHIDHTTVAAVGGSAIAITGANIASNFTIALDITNLTAITVLEVASDFIVVFDDSNNGNRKILVDALIGEKLGDGKWFRSSNIATSAGVPITVAFNSADYDDLERGTFSIATGEYTVGADAIRIFISAQLKVAALNEADQVQILVQVNGTTKAVMLAQAITGFGGVATTVMASTTLNLSAADVVRIRVETDSAESITLGVANTFVSIVELS